MTVRAKPKPDSATETARVLRVFDMLHEELGEREHERPNDPTWAFNTHDAILAIADRIAARTEDPA